MEFFKCNHCGNIIAYVKNSGVRVNCCGSNMVELVANSTDASVEKHVPTCSREGKYLHVSVGGGSHPQTREHHIEWIALVTRNGNQRKVLNSEGEPKVSFLIEEDDEVKEVYAYCNLHGLWTIKD
jgi:superoxide reductase